MRAGGEALVVPAGQREPSAVDQQWPGLQEIAVAGQVGAASDPHAVTVETDVHAGAVCAPRCVERHVLGVGAVDPQRTQRDVRTAYEEAADHRVLRAMRLWYPQPPFRQACLP